MLLRCVHPVPQLSAIRNYEPPKATIGLRKVPSPEPVHHATETEEDDEEEWNSQGNVEEVMSVGSVASDMDEA